MNEFLDMKFSIREIAKSASRALRAIYSKFLCARGMTISVCTKLVETMVEPVLFFCSGLWGYTIVWKLSLSSIKRVGFSLT